MMEWWGKVRALKRTGNIEDFAAMTSIWPFRRTVEKFASCFMFPARGTSLTRLGSLCLVPPRTRAPFYRLICISGALHKFDNVYG